MSNTRDVRGDDIFDSRDAIARRDELVEERDSYNAADKVKGAWELEFPDDAEELADLEAFIEEADYGDFQNGDTCIRDSYFETYAQELADELGVLKDANTWPLTCIDWKRAARELQYDYSSAELAGVTYWFRS